MAEHRRKTLRSFYCDEGLWQTVEKLARDRDSTVDQLLNDAIKRFAAGGPDSTTPPVGAAQPDLRRPSTEVPRAAGPGSVDEAMTGRLPAVRGPAPPPPPGAPPPLSAPPPAPFAPPAPPGAAPNFPPPPVSPSGARPPVAPPGPPPAPPGAPGARPARQSGSVTTAPSGMPAMFVHFEGRAYPVAKDRFVIGRGTQGTDLTIRDGNISRKHAAVIFHTGSFYIQDLGSTNGVEYMGNRVDTKKIEEGDIYHICDHELRFTFQG